MAKPPMATPGHYGGGVFDILSSPSNQPAPSRDVEPELPTPVPDPGSWVTAVGGLLLVGGLALALWLTGNREEDAEEEGNTTHIRPAMLYCTDGHGNTSEARTCTTCGACLPDPDLDGYGGM